MAATAYGALVSLLNTMDQILAHPLLSTFSDNFQFNYIRENVDFFLNFVEKCSDADIKEADDLVKRIAAAAHEAEDIIEVEAAKRVYSGSTTKSLTLLFGLQRMIEDMNSIKENVIKFKEETGLFINSMPPSLSSSSSSSSAAAAAAAPLATTKTNMVGFEGYLAKLLDELTGHDSGRRILPIVGMGGIGKTTLARNVYQNSLIAYHFDVRSWVTVSQQYNVTEILLEALSCLGGSKTKMDKTDDELGEELYKKLFGRRYLIVLDDVWSVEAWNKIKFFFPEKCDRGRIVVTTRQQELVDYFGSSAISVDFLDDNLSWDLFCEKTFSQEGCPTELEEIGKKIVKKCKGLPLAISVVGGLLGKSPRTQEYWEKIAQDRSLVLEYSGDEGKNLLTILNMSYKHLPVCLKPCFLYLGLFPEDHQIDVSELIKLLVAEGYIKPSRNQSLEEVAESYIKELVDRNLLLVGHLRRQKKELRSCRLHDLVRELCISIAEKENFYCVHRDIDGRRQFIVDERSASIYPRESITCSEKPSVIRPAVIFRRQREAPFKSRLLRVFFGSKQSESDEFFSGYYFQQVNLRFLSNKFMGNILHSSISLCWSLQTLILHHCGSSEFVPSEIWKMSHLKHIEILKMRLPDPPTCGNDVIVMHNLQTLKTVVNLIFTEEVCKRIPNVKDLEITYMFEAEYGITEYEPASTLCFQLQNVGCLNKLESLQYYIFGEYVGEHSLQNFKLPNSLKELTLRGCCLAWSDMAMIASLPHLQVLELIRDAVAGPEWNCVGEKFLCLRYLLIFNCNLINWIAESSNFPVLETLHLWDLPELDEIPSGVGEIRTLERMQIMECSESATVSAIKILEEQESLGNQDLQLQLRFPYVTEIEMWREKIQQSGFISQNLHFSNSWESDKWDPS